MSEIKKVVLAYSGGLDTSVILKWLKETYNCEVVTFTADLGQDEDYEVVRKKAEQQDVKEIFIEDLKENELERQENSISFEWKTEQMFSVDLDPKIGGEHVHVYVSAKWVNDTVTNAFRGVNRAYVIDGKIVDWEGFYRSEANE